MVGINHSHTSFYIYLQFSSGSSNAIQKNPAFTSLSVVDDELYAIQGCQNVTRAALVRMLRRQEKTAYVHKYRLQQGELERIKVIEIPVESPSYPTISVRRSRIRIVFANTSKCSEYSLDGVWLKNLHERSQSDDGQRAYICADDVDGNMLMAGHSPSCVFVVTPTDGRRQMVLTLEPMVRSPRVAAVWNNSLFIVSGDDNTLYKYQIVM